MFSTAESRPGDGLIFMQETPVSAAAFCFLKSLSASEVDLHYKCWQHYLLCVLLNIGSFNYIGYKTIACLLNKKEHKLDTF